MNFLGALVVYFDKRNVSYEDLWFVSTTYFTNTVRYSEECLRS